MELSGEQLEEPEPHEEYERPRQVGVLMEIGIHPKRVHDRGSLAPDLAGVDAELFEEGELVVESDSGGGAAGEDGGGERGGGGSRSDVEGHEGYAGVCGARGLEGGGGEAALLHGAAGISDGREDDRGHVEFLRHGRGNDANSISKGMLGFVDWKKRGWELNLRMEIGVNKI
eukprot:TRINITY_DN951_c0_g2_i1.p2 TRINITY_DN951_c0_g2~~TRINITY_DN951_c0_g2_i1.p2  ORF type:complete len:172 (+),score=32.77 TRINITY_DN951_c0_g2_i1:433-948(+)